MEMKTSGFGQPIAASLAGHPYRQGAAVAAEQQE